MQKTTVNPDQTDAYVHDYDGALTEQVIASRTAAVHAAFLAPYLHADMDILDCGCGPGSITVGLADVLTNGSVTGIDISESQVTRARKFASDRGCANVAFEVGDARDLPFENARFDAVFSHAMIEHLSDPSPALAEMHRVLKPGGLAAIRCIDLGGTIISPDDGRLAAGHEIWRKYREHCGGDAFMGRRLRGLLHETGFVGATGAASSETWATPERTRLISSVMTEEFSGPKIASTAEEMGWASRADMEEIGRAFDEWATHPDAFMTITWGEAIAWRDRP
ncbi:MAG: class I SAM-dependent methyltransferase [Pseudomonadota bacterium]